MDWTLFFELLPQYVGLIALLAAIRQIQLARLGSLLAAEGSLDAARARYVDKDHELKSRHAAMKSLKEEAAKDTSKLGPLGMAIAEQELGERHLDELYRHYLNRLDRICASVGRGEIRELHAKADYEGMVGRLCDEDPGILTRGEHENIAACYTRWCMPSHPRKWSLWNRPLR